MREILFRGKRVINDDWVEGSLLLCNLTPAYGPQIMWYTEEGLVSVDVLPETVGQYTGLTDKNGKRIFEGDIIRYADETEYRCYLESLELPEEYEKNAFNNMWTVDKVVYCANEGYPAFDLNRHDFEANGLSELSESYQYFYEIIGNIHDNPELLEVEHE